MAVSGPVRCSRPRVDLQSDPRWAVEEGTLASALRRHTWIKRIAVAGLFATASTALHAEDLPPLAGAGTHCTFCAAAEFDRLVALLGDQVLKDMVCRLAFQSYTLGTLSHALGLPADRVRGRIDTLRRWGLVHSVSADSRGTIVEPLPGEGARTLRRWARRYCPLGDGCTVPEGDAGAEPEEEIPLSLGDGIPLPFADNLERQRRFFQAMVRFDAINLGDPVKIDREGEIWAREVYLSRRRSYWLHKLSPNANELIRLAARAMHIARWEIPRDSYPKGRLGYHQWRGALAKYHAEKTADILAEMVYRSDEISRVKDLVQKKNFKLDPDAQLLEDVASIVFFEAELPGFAPSQSDEKLKTIVRKTWYKMSPRGREAVRKLELSTVGRELVRNAISENRDVKY